MFIADALERMFYKLHWSYYFSEEDEEEEDECICYVDSNTTYRDLFFPLSISLSLSTCNCQSNGLDQIL